MRSKLAQFLCSCAIGELESGLEGQSTRFNLSPHSSVDRGQEISRRTAGLHIDLEIRPICGTHCPSTSGTTTSTAPPITRRRGTLAGPASASRARSERMPQGRSARSSRRSRPRVSPCGLTWVDVVLGTHKARDSRARSARASPRRPPPNHRSVLARFIQPTAMSHRSGALLPDAARADRPRARASRAREGSCLTV